ncbi:low temperature requirement protein A [Streptomyces tateyamensis]|uniref:low temperature requirement protein A n=1 Tax=Streptomyces tateyamensis TaxID=565073 RepID=UPI001FE27A30|nr:low temperature requirement protein A [Streptomyces tateyamensis]
MVLVAQAAHHLAGQLTWRGTGEYGAVFGLVWIAWLNGSAHHELHGHEDARARVTFLLQILVLVPLGGSIPQAGGERGTAFAVAAGVLFAVLAVLWVLASRGDEPGMRRAGRPYVVGTAGCAVVLGVSALLPAGARVWTWGGLDLAYLAGLSVLILRQRPGAATTLAVTDALIERFGLLIIIVLGETVTGVVTGLSAEPTAALTLAVGLVAVVAGFGAWWTYFDFVGHRQPRATPPATLQWMLGHLPLTAAVAAMGAAMVGLVEHAHADRTATATAWVLCTGAALVLVSTMTVAGSLTAWRSKREFYRPLSRTCGATALACLGLAALRPAPLLLGVLLVLLLSIPWGVAVAYLLRHPEPEPDAPAGL